MSDELNEAGKRIIKSCETIIQKCDRSIEDIIYWNENHADEALFPDDYAMIIAKRSNARRIIKCVRDGQPIPDDCPPME